MHVPFLDLVSHHRPFRDRLLQSFGDILDTASFVNGPRVAEFEERFAEAHHVGHAVAVANGTVALELILRALGIGPGSRVIVPVNTFIATAEAVSNVGGEPVFVDCDDSTWTISVEGVSEALARGQVDAVMVVHLYGQPGPIDELRALTEPLGIPLIEDAAQAHLAEYRGRKVGGLSVGAGFSFYPGKNLGGVGEGGAVTTNDDDLAERVRALRDHGQSEKYRSVVIGTNARMSEIVGAGLGLELERLQEWTDRRRWVAARYRDRLEATPGVTLTVERDHVRGVHHLYVVHVDERDRVRRHLTDSGVGTGLHYPIPIHLQEAYAGTSSSVTGAFPNAEWSAARMLSLPMYPELTADQIDYVCDRLLEVAGVPE